MLGNFNTPSVDHLREGIDYVMLEWDFASGVPHVPGEPCPPGHKMIWGMCRRLKSGTEDWNPDEDSDIERAGKIKAKEVGSTFQTNKPVEIGGKKYGWAKKNGKDVMVEWGSICAKKVNGVCVSADGVPASPIPQKPSQPATPTIPAPPKPSELKTPPTSSVTPPPPPVSV